MEENYCAVDLFSPPVCCGHRECKLAVEGEYCLHLSLLIPIPPVDVLMYKTLLTSEAAVRGSGKENKPLVISSCYFAKAVFSAGETVSQRKELNYTNKCVHESFENWRPRTTQTTLLRDRN